MYNNRGNWWSSIPPVTKNLILINILIWIVEMIFPSFANNGIVRVLGLHYIGGNQFNPIQLITYMFVHAPNNFAHILFNMFTLWMFGRFLENVWGSKRFLIYYFICGIGGAIIQEIVWASTYMHEYISGIAPLNGLTYDSMKQIVDASIANGDSDFINAIAQYKNSMVTIGASGAIYGVLLGFGMVFPNTPLYLFFIPVPIKAKYMVIGYGIIEFMLGVTNSMNSVAHFAHLGGMLFGLVLLLIWKNKGTLRGGKFY